MGESKRRTHVKASFAGCGVSGGRFLALFPGLSFFGTNFVDDLIMHDVGLGFSCPVHSPWGIARGLALASAESYIENCRAPRSVTQGARGERCKAGQRAATHVIDLPIRIHPHDGPNAPVFRPERLHRSIGCTNQQRQMRASARHRGGSPWVVATS